MSYFPNMTEFVVLALGSVGACAAGAILFWLWSLRHRNRPVTITILALIVGCIVFGSAQYSLYRGADIQWQEDVAARAAATASARAEAAVDGQESAGMTAITLEAQRGVEARHLHIFLYGILFAMLPLWYFVRAIANSLADGPVEEAFAMRTEPDERSPFRAAQALAMGGDIEGAVEQYRRYTFNQSEALLAAARLLQNDGRYDESATMYRELMDNYRENVRTWSEAIFELAKLKDTAFGERQEAVRLLNQLVERDPDGQFGHMAIRLQRRILAGQQEAVGGGEAVMAALDAQFEAETPRTVDPPAAPEGHPTSS